MEETVASNEIRHPKKVAFLAAYAVCGTITRAAEIAEIDRSTHYEWMTPESDVDGTYAKAFAAAGEEAADRLEEEARRRAHDGLKRLKFHQGQVIVIPKVGPDGKQVLDAQGAPVMVPYVEHEYSDTLLIFLLNGARPQKFRKNVDVTSGGKAVKAFIDVDDGD